MATPVFEWNPDVGTELDEEPDVTVTKFGDGYELRVPKGINNTPEKWTLKFTRSILDTAMLDFLRARNGVEKFAWTSPLGETKHYVCRKWKLGREKGIATMNVEFEQVFEA